MWLKARQCRSLESEKNASINWNRWNDWKTTIAAEKMGVEDIHTKKRSWIEQPNEKYGDYVSIFKQFEGIYGRERKTTKVAFLLWSLPNWIHIRLCVLDSFFVLRLNDYGWNWTKKQVYWITICYDFVVRLFGLVCWLFVEHSSLLGTFHQNQNEMQLRKKERNIKATATLTRSSKLELLCTPKSFSMLLCFTLIRSFTHRHTLLPILFSLLLLLLPQGFFTWIDYHHWKSSWTVSSFEWEVVTKPTETKSGELLQTKWRKRRTARMEWEVKRDEASNIDSAYICTRIFSEKKAKKNELYLHREQRFPPPPSLPFFSTCSGAW